ncbi:PAP/fibrillin family protein [Kamptonema formosum]|uniref:PAP/fibrillin family protein n=1 Tax=Kamptonema formosum TaxID=331992 RepID=UPI0018E268CB|nr:PAP/fibrillin family protein [Oscillatoria sp. PCC 10802]
MRNANMVNSELASIKEELISISTAADTGFNCDPAIGEQIEKLASQIEALTPTEDPTGQMEAVEGRWRLLYSSFGQERETTLDRLAFGKLPKVPVSITGIFQEISTDSQQYNNLIEFTAGSGIKGVAKIAGRYTVENSKRLNIDFLEASAIPASDLSAGDFRDALGINGEDALESPLSFSGWSDITYLDGTLRLMRGNRQNLYVLVRDSCR